MAKFAKCDICEVVGEGRVPEGFHEIYKYEESKTKPSGYFDLCDKCYNEYKKIENFYEKEFREKVIHWMEEKQNLKGENNVSRN